MLEMDKELKYAKTKLTAVIIILCFCILIDRALLGGAFLPMSSAITPEKPHHELTKLHLLPMFPYHT